MADQTELREETERAEVLSPEVVDVEETPEKPPQQKQGWLKGPLGMAICCGTPFLLIAAISLFGVSLGAIASGALSLAAVLACPLGMWIMMRMMMNQKK